MIEFNRIAYQIDALSTEALPDVPVSPKRSNAPVTRAIWEATNLPEGVTLSATGQLSGRPTQTGTYDVDATVKTNWGSDTRTIRIVVQ